MVSIDEEFRIRSNAREDTRNHPLHRIASADTDERTESRHADPNGQDPRFRPTFAEDTPSSPTGDALAHRLSTFQGGRRLKSAARVLSECSTRPAERQQAGGPRPRNGRDACGGDGAAAAGECIRNASTPSEDRKSANCFSSLASEDDEGDVEYKWRLTGVSALRFEHLVTQMKFRVSEGRGQCLYELGVADNGTLRGLPTVEFAESVDTIQRMARTLGFDCAILQECVVHREPEPLYCAELLVSRRHARCQDLSLCFCGSLGSGKTTLMGTLLSSTLDDGHGSTRQSLFNHKHEVDSGRTTSIATRVWTVSCGTRSPLGGDCCPSGGSEVEVSLVLEDGGVDAGAVDAAPVDHPHHHQRVLLHEEDDDSHRSRDREEVGRDQHASGLTDGSSGECLFFSSCSDAVPSAMPALLANGVPAKDEEGGEEREGKPMPSPPSLQADRGSQVSHRGRGAARKHRLISLMDVGGDITKTSLFGLMSRRPDFVCLCVSANSSAESVPLYAQVCCAIGTPFLVAVTKTDAVEDFELDGFCMDVAATLRNTVGCACDVVEDEGMALAYCRTWLPQQRDGAVFDGGLEGGPSFVKQSPRVPLFCVSSVTGAGLELLKFAIAHLPRSCASVPMTPLSASTRPSFEVLLDYAFQVKGVGPVVRGRVSSGSSVEVGCACYMGPDETGAFYPVAVRGIHVDGAHVNEAQAGDEATFALDRLPAAVALSHKGKVLVRQPKNVASRFHLTVRVLSQCLTQHLEPILYSRNARQAVRLLACHPRSPVFRPSTEIPSAGRASETAERVKEEEFEVEAAFLFRPEVLTFDASVVLRWEPRGLAVGKVTRIHPPRP